MPRRDPWAAIQAKLGSAENHFLQASVAILPRPMPARYHVAIQSSGLIGSNPNRQRQELHSHITTFLVECRSIPDVIQSYFGAYRNTAWLRDPDERRRRGDFQRAFTPLYHKFRKLLLSRARVDTVHGQGFADIWVMKSGKRYSPLESLPVTENAFAPGSGPPLPLAASITPALQWAATLPPQPVLHQPSDFFFKTAGGRYKPLFPECNTYLQRTREFVAISRALYDKVHDTHPLTKPPR